MPPDAPRAALLIRADARTQSGIGHIMRCFALAEEWRTRGGEVVFLSRCDSEGIRAKIEAAGMRVIPLPDADRGHEDLPAIAAILRSVAPSAAPRPWVVLDGYHFDGSFQEQVTAMGARVLVVDDLRGPDPYHAHLILNQNTADAHRSYRIPPETLLLLGPKYALLRREVIGDGRPERGSPQTPARVLVTLGGSDPGNATEEILRALEAVDVALEVAALVGPLNPHAERLTRIAAAHRHGVRVVRDPSAFPALLQWADVAISAGGSTCWELAWAGLPALVVVLTENQQGPAECVHRAGAAVNLGWLATVGPARIAAELARVCADAARWRAMSEAGRTLVDGRGTGRVVDVMEALQDAPGAALRWQLRAATPDDAVAIWRLANDPGVRSNSFHPEPIPLDAHLGWYARKLTSDGTRIWLAEIGGTLIAQVRFDRIDDTAVVNIAVVPALRGRGVGTALLEATAARACRELGVTRLRALVLPENAPSAKAFEKAGFVRRGETQEHGRRCHVFERPCA